MFFRAKEGKQSEDLDKDEQLPVTPNLFVSTLPSCDKPYEVIGIVTSALADSSVPFSTFMDEIKKEAYNLGADAVIGITFQSIGTTDSFPAERIGTCYFCRVESRAVGTAIKFIQKNE